MRMLAETEEDAGKGRSASPPRLPRQVLGQRIIHPLAPPATSGWSSCTTHEIIKKRGRVRGGLGEAAHVRAAAPMRTDMREWIYSSGGRVWVGRR